MTLRQDCELWATFDAEDVDPSRGIVRDRSGKGRTLEASGGPTYGQPSPVGEAVGLDGTDDKFTIDTSLDNAGPQSFAVLISGGEGSIFGQKTNDSGYNISTGFGFVIFSLFNDSGNQIKAQYSKDPPYRNLFIIGVYDGSEMRIYDSESNVRGRTDISSRNLATAKPAVGAQKSSGSAYFEGRISFVANWSRALSDDEIEELNRMTDRMVSKL